MKIICVGRNFPDHARELKNNVPTEPVLFLKPETALLRNNQDFFLPDFSNEIHYEVEITFRIGKIGKNVAQKFAQRYIDSIGLGIDFTARDLQNQLKNQGLPWEISKGFDYSAVISPFIPKAGFNDLKQIRFRLEKNGTTVQEGLSGDMLFSMDEIVAYASRFFSLKTGDIFFTGTPAGVGPVQPGDRLRGFLEDRLMFDFFVK